MYKQGEGEEREKRGKKTDRLTVRHSDTARYYTGRGGRDIIDRQTDRLTVTHTDTDR